MGIDEGDVKPDIDIVPLAFFVTTSFTGVKFTSEFMENSTALMERLQTMSTTITPAFSTRKTASSHRRRPERSAQYMSDLSTRRAAEPRSA